MLSLNVPNVLPVLSVVLFISLLNDGLFAFAAALTSTASELFFACVVFLNHYAFWDS